MGKLKTSIETETLLFNIIEGIRKVKGKEIVDIDLTGLEQRICQHFLICHGDSNRHVSAIADSVESEIKEKLDWPSIHREGYENAIWILLDYGSIVVHVFQKEYRDFYQLEKLWADGIIVKID
jgi:ribosome-associated protein